MTGRYEAFGPEAEFEPGSRGRALRNRLGITSVRALQQRESEALLATTQQVIDQVTVDQNFTAADICRLHHLWLGKIYEWAGEYRSVNIAKGEFMFAAAAQVPRLMQQLEQGPLRLYTPCRIKSTGSGTRNRACRVHLDPPLSSYVALREVVNTLRPRSNIWCEG
jgi:cell filamentation protein